MRTLLLLSGALLLGLGLACGGGAESSSPAVRPAATGFTYSDPGGTGWRLVRNPASTRTRLILDLHGPAGLMTRGAAFNLRAPEGVRFATFPDGQGVQDGGVYELLNSTGAPDPLEPKLMLAALKPGNVLTVGLFQKDRRVTAKDAGASLFSIVLEFDGTAGVHAGQGLRLEVLKARYMGEDIGGADFEGTYAKAAKAHTESFSLAVGTLIAQ